MPEEHVQPREAVTGITDRPPQGPAPRPALEGITPADLLRLGHAALALAGPGEADGGAGQLARLLALVAQYAEHHRAADEARREQEGLRGMRILEGVAALALAVSGVLVIIDQVAGLSAGHPPGHASGGLAFLMLASGVVALAVLVFEPITRRECRRKKEEAARGQAEALRQLLAAFPQLGEPARDAAAASEAITR